MRKAAALMLTAALLASSAIAPAQAQRFGIFFGDEPSDFYPERIICMTDRQIRDAIAKAGYSNIALNVPHEEHVQVRATRGGNVYLLDFNYCTGVIEGWQMLRPAN